MATKKTTTKKAPAMKAAGAKADGKPKKLSALDAAAKLLAESKKPTSSREMIDAMAAKKYWTSPGGKTPHATLYSAIARSIKKEGKESRFRKAERGKFGLNG